MRSGWAVLTAIVLPLFALPLPVSASQLHESGDYNGLSWVLEGHTLTVTGNAAVTTKISDSRQVYPGWKAYAEDIYEIVLEEGVTGAEQYALSGYANLQKLTLPSTFTSLAPYALYDCPALGDIEGMEYVTDFNYRCLTGTAYTAAHPFVITDGRLYYAECTEFTVPEGVTEIMPYAFGNLTGSEYLGSAAPQVTVVLPEGVEIIHENAFAFCAGLSAVHFPESLKEIGERAFFNCTRLGNVTLGEQVERVGALAFYNCRSIETLTVLDPETEFGEDAYGLCMDWEAALEARRGKVSEESYERAAAALQADPFLYDDQMTNFAIHVPRTRAYSEVKSTAGSAYTVRRGLLRGDADSSAQRFATENKLPFRQLLPGDVNDNGIVDIMDVIALNKFLLGAGALDAVGKHNADLDRSNGIDTTDSLHVLKLVVER